MCSEARLGGGGASDEVLSVKVLCAGYVGRRHRWSYKVVRNRRLSSFSFVVKSNLVYGKSAGRWADLVDFVRVRIVRAHGRCIRAYVLRFCLFAAVMLRSFWMLRTIGDMFETAFEAECFPALR